MPKQQTVSAFMQYCSFIRLLAHDSI